MKIKLLIISFLLTIVLTGCNANYTLTIENEKIIEEFSVVENNSDYLDIKDDSGKSFYDYAKLYGEEQNTSVDYDALYSQVECSKNCIYYDKLFINDEDGVGFKLSHEFSFNEYTFSSIAKELIPEFTVKYDGRYLQISGKTPSNYFKDFENLNNMSFEINSNYKVVSTNLKKKKSGSYIWEKSNKDVINRDDLYITFDTKNEVVIEEEKEEGNVLILFAILGGLFILLIVVVVFNKGKQN